MILVYSEKISPRLQYICRFILGEHLGIEYSLTVNPNEFSSHIGPRINYSHLPSEDRGGKIFHLIPHGLLSENDIRHIEIKVKKHKDYPVFFHNDAGHFGFDIFSAVFYLISRYEEYLIKEKDMYGRFPHQQSIAYRENFLKEPVVNFWIRDFSKSLKSFFPDLEIKEQHFSLTPTYDIDIAYSYKGKGFLRNAGAFLLKPSAERLSVIAGKRKDPFDSYDYLDHLHKMSGLKPVYFFLLAKSTGRYDRNIRRNSHEMNVLVRHHLSRYKTGIHPSWKSNESFAILNDEKKFLEQQSGKPVNASRQHYIKFNLPETYRNLLQAGITEDYSMGYGTVNGFRASAASSFFWYDLEKEMETALRIHPFCFMEANCHYEQQQTAEESFDELMHYLNECKKACGSMITIFHNNFLGTSAEFKGWREVYSRFISQVPR